MWPALTLIHWSAQGTLELQVLGNKGARSEVLRRTFLPLVAPIYSLGSHDWFRAWLQAREALGLETGGRFDCPIALPLWR